MDVKKIKEELHTLIENSSEDKLSHIYSFFETTTYTDDFKTILDDEFASYQTDKIGDTRGEVNAMINTMMSAKW